MPGRPSSAVTASLAASAGLTSLVLELLWIRLAGIETGSPLAAFTLIITCFMMGMAAGSFAFGRLADRTDSPLRIFGISQIGVGLLGAVTSLGASSGGLARPLLLWFDLAPRHLPFELTLVLTHGAVSGAAALLAGGSLPLLVRRMGPGSQLARRAGILASLQAAGGATGALLCGFVLLPYAGLRLSFLAMACIAVLTGLAAMLAATRSPAVPSTFATGSRPDDPKSRLGALQLAACAALLVSGLAITVLEVAWARLTALSFGSSAQAASVVLALVIAGLTAGYAAGGSVATKTNRPGWSLLCLLSAGALSILAGDIVFSRLPMAVTWIETSVLTDAAGWRLPVAWLALLVAPVGIPSALLGAVYPLSLRLLALEGPSPGRDGRRTGQASALSAIGNMAGPPFAYYGILGSLGSRGCLLLPAIALCLVALPLAIVGPGGARRPVTRLLIPLVPISLTAAILLWLPWDPDLASSGPYLYASYYRSAMERSSSGLGEAVRQRGEVIFSREGPDSLVTVRRSPAGLLSLQVNGKTDASTGGDLKTQALMAHLPLLVHETSPGFRPRVLIVGLGSGVTAAAALTHPVERVDVIEISPGVVAAAALFVESTGDLMSDPRLRLIPEDVRTYLLFGSTGVPPYDIIASQPSNPWIAGQAILFTREFFELAASRLAPGGVMCQWLQGQGLPAQDFRSIVATFAAVFAHVSLWEESNAGGDYLLLGSSEPIRIAESVLDGKMNQEGVAKDLGRIEIRTPADLLEHHVSSGKPLRELARGAVIQTEDRSSLEFTAPSALHRETLGEILALLEPARSALPDLIAASPALSEELSRRDRAARDDREWAEGLGLLAPSLQLDPDLVRAASYLSAGMRAHALEAVRALALRTPSQRAPHLMAAYVLMSMPGHRDEAELAEVIRELKLAVMLDPSEPRARLFLSRALRAAGALDEALRENGAIPNPRPAEADSDRCALFIESGDGASAEAACLEALSRNPGLAAAHANLGVLRSRRGRLEEAVESYRRALQIDPTLIDTRYNLAALYGRQARDRDGFELLRALVLPPASGADAATFTLAARLAVGAGLLKEARACLSESRARGAGGPETEEVERILLNAEGERSRPR